MRRPRSTTMSSSTMPPWRACCRAAGCAYPMPLPFPPSPRSAAMSFKFVFLAGLVLAASPVVAADYVQAPGSVLAFAGTYEGEAFTGRFPGFVTRFSFNAAKFPQARYTATSFRALGGNNFVADGTLNLRGVIKPVALTFTWTPGAQPVLSGKALVKRLDFGVGQGDWAETDLVPNAIAVSTKVIFAPAK